MKHEISTDGWSRINQPLGRCGAIVDDEQPNVGAALSDDTAYAFDHEFLVIVDGNEPRNQG